MADLSKQRPLMPYELRLCQELGVTEEEYRQFLDAMYDQMARKPIPGDAPVNGPVLPIISFVVGVLFQVVGLLLRPGAPQQRDGATAPNQGEQAAPTFGFSSVQDLARIGEIVPQVYCDRRANPAGGARVNTKLLWSQVESYGNAQLGKFLTVISDAELVEIDATATGVGSSLVQSVAGAASWQYYVSRNGQFGYLQQNSSGFQINFLGIGRQPGPDPSGSQSYLVPRGFGKTFGTSQAYTPKSSTAFGFSAIIPIVNACWVVFQESNGDEKVIRDWNRIRIDGSTASIAQGFVSPGLINNFVSVVSFEPFQNERTTQQITRTVTTQVPQKRIISVPVFDDQGNLLRGDPVEIVFDTITQQTQVTDTVTVDNKVAVKHSQLRNSIVQALSPASSYVFGRTVFRFEPFNPFENTDIRKGSVAARFRLIEGSGFKAFASETDNLFEFQLGLVQDNPRSRRHFLLSEFGSYSTVARVDAVEFSIKARVWAELNSQFRNDQSANGDRPRTAFFSCRYRRVGETFFNDVIGLFSLTRATKSETFFFIRFEFPNRDEWEIQFNPVVDWVINFPNFIYQIDATKPLVVDAVPGGATVCFNGTKLGVASSDDLSRFVFTYPEGPNSAVWQSDVVYRPLLDANYSWEQGPEFEIIAANEIQYDSQQVTYYSDLSLLGLNIYGGRARQDITQISALVRRGKRINRIDQSGITLDASNRFPDIFFDTLTSRSSGLGQFVTNALVDFDSLYIANRFVTTNQLYWDGVIDQEVNWRQWATEQAGFSLLQVITKNGKFGLQPVVPVEPFSGSISPTGYTIKALFNEGNILSGSYTESLIAAEESLNQVVTVRYRELQASAQGIVGFPRERSVSFRLFEGSDNDRETVVNAAGSVTTEAQARLIATYLLVARRYEDRTISFKTAEPWLGLAPGDIIRVDTTFTAFEGNYAGRVLEDGTIDIYGYDGAKQGNGVALVYLPGSGIQSISISGGTKLPGYAGALIAIGSQVNENRLWTITKIDIDEEGIATVNAKLFPVIAGSGVRPSLVATALQSPFSYVTQVRSGG